MTIHHQPSSTIRVAIDNLALSDLVEISLRLEGFNVDSDDDTTPSLLITDSVGFQSISAQGDTALPRSKVLLLVSSESEIPPGWQYLIVPRHLDTFSLDPELLVRKVQELLSGLKPSPERNPVTGLPGAAAFDSELRERINTGERFGVIFADLNHFKTYNKAYSYARGDEMLRALGGLIRSAIDRHPHPQNFLAHLRSDDFAVITSEKLAPVIAQEIVDEFDEMVASFYEVADLARGCVTVTDRHGNVSRDPLVTIALAVVLSSKREIRHAAEVLDISEELLRYLKSRDIVESCCIVDPAR